MIRLLVVKQNEPFVPAKKLIIIPRSVLYGPFTKSHLRLFHPSGKQVRIVMKQFLFAFDMDKTIDSITAACLQCSALKKVLHFATQQTTSKPPETTVNAHLLLKL